MTYCLDDITIIPAVISTIEHRDECHPYNEDGMLPIFTAPMTALINEGNYKQFQQQRINTIIPRSVSLEIRKTLWKDTFVALGLQEFEEFINSYEVGEEPIYICVDIANGHMKKLIDLCAKCKELFGGHVILMTGNIANPDTYAEYAKAGIDFVRCSIGTGSACTTSANSGCHMPIASLLTRIVNMKYTIARSMEYCKATSIECEYRSLPLIIADGGFNNFDQIIKALVLGADYVMLGKLLSQTTAACGVQVKGERVYYGMSTKRAQVELGAVTPKTAEGIEIRVPITTTLEGWIENFIHYLQTAMSYTNCKNLNDLTSAKWELMSPNARKSYQK